jgi:EmrB/QacA subfamily drug resistance transporter
MLPKDRRPLAIALIVAAAFFMENLDGTVIATALPQMAASFGVRPVALNLGMTAYILSLAVFIPISGWTADRFGPRSVFAAAIVLFTAASLLCGVSQSLPGFIAARIVQGLGGAMMVPVGRLVVLRGTAKADLMRAMGYITWPGLVAPILGPPLGGFLTTYASWRWIFLLNLPLGLVALALVLRLFDNRRSSEQRPFDVRGFVLSGIALPCLMYAMELIGSAPGRLDGSAGGGGAGGWAAAAAALAAALGFGTLAVRHARRTPHPLIDLGALAVPTFAVSVWAGSLFRMAINSMPFLVPLLLQVGFGMTAFDAGKLVLAGSVGNLGMKSVTNPILRRYGFRTVLLANGLLAAASIAACALLAPGTPGWLIIAVLFGGGLFRSMQFTALATIQFADIAPARMGPASSFASMVQQLSMGMGIAFAAMVLQLAAALRGDAHLSLGDFRVAFLATGLVVVAGVLGSVGLARDAGAAVSGHSPAAPARERRA